MLNNLIHKADRSVFLSDSFVLSEYASNEYIFIKILEKGILITKKFYIIRYYQVIKNIILHINLFRISLTIINNFLVNDSELFFDNLTL